MSTLKQIEANRLNARKSTGPITAQGKAQSRWNAIKTGIDAQSHVIPGECPDALEVLTIEHHERWLPATPEQRALVDDLVHSEWLLRRFRKIEAQIWKLKFKRLDDHDDLDPDNPLAQVFINSTENLDRLQRRIDSTERNFHRTLKALERLHAQLAGPRPNPEPVAQLIPQPVESQPGSSAIGFVPSSAPEPVSARSQPPGIRVGVCDMKAEPQAQLDF